MNNELIDVKTLKPFTRFIYTIGVLPTSYLMSMTYEEQLIWLCNYLSETVIPTVNNNGEAVTELQNLYVELKNYVDNYFENLDVQEEINNKLDEMALSGTLADIMAEYLNSSALIRFDTVDDMKLSEDLRAGMIVGCYGLKELNDHQGGYYKILETGTIDDKYIIGLQNNLKAHLINNINDNYYDVTYKTGRYDNTDYYITEVPYLDENNNIIKLEVEKDEVNAPLEHSHKEYTSFTCNANVGFYDVDDDNSFHDNLVIGNGEILNPVYPYVTPLPDYYQYLCFKDNRDYASFQANNTDSSTILASGYTQAFMVYFKLITDGEADLPTGTILTDRSPKQIIGIKEDKTLIIMSTDGRNERNKGLVYEDCVNILLENGCYNAWATDGGGSTSTIVKGTKINRNYDDEFTTDRLRPYTLNAKRTIVNKNIANSYNMRGTQLQLLNKQILDLIIAKYKPSVVNITFPGYTTVAGGTAEKIPMNINYSFNSDITYDSTDKSLILNKGIYMVNGAFYVSSIGNGNKYSAGMLNSTELTLLSLSTNYNNQRIQFNHTYILNVTEDNTKFYMTYNGTTGDSIQRGSMNIQKLKN